MVTDARFAVVISKPDVRRHTGLNSEHQQDLGQMNICIVGHGKVGTALGTGLTSAGHTVSYAGRDNTASAVTGADVVIVAAASMAVFDIIEALKGLPAGTIVIDAMNSVAKSPDGYLTTTHAMQDRLPQVRVVKCFNSVGYEIMANPAFGAHRADMFMAGDDAEAKAVAHRLALDIGFSACHDVGGSARFVSLEHLAMVWISMAMGMGKGRSFAWHLLER